MGEAWHNNHHAFPESARLGLYPGQSDPGFVFLKALERVGLAWDIKTPETLATRKLLHRVENKLDRLIQNQMASPGGR